MCFFFIDLRICHTFEYQLVAIKGKEFFITQKIFNILKEDKQRLMSVFLSEIFLKLNMNFVVFFNVLWYYYIFFCLMRMFCASNHAMISTHSNLKTNLFHMINMFC